MVGLDPFKLAGNYSEKSGNPISEILISKSFRGVCHTAAPPPSSTSHYRPRPPIDFLLTRPCLWVFRLYTNLFNIFFHTAYASTYTVWICFFSFPVIAKARLTLIGWFQNNTKVAGNQYTASFCYSWTISRERYKQHVVYWLEEERTDFINRLVNETKYRP